MKLTLTRYIDASPVDVERRLSDAIGAALAAAAERTGTTSGTPATAPVDHGVRIDAGLEALAGSHVRIGGTERLAVLEVDVPWTAADASGDKLLAANRFTSVVATSVSAA